MDSQRRFKIDLFMPLEIGRYLQDTAHLDTLKSGAYLHLLMHYWSHGPLPNDMDQLASIARMSPDAWSIAYAVLKQFFSIGPDGLLHQVGADRRLEFWTGKRLKASEKASKAARTRWDKHKAKQEVKNDAPSITQAMPEQCPISISEEEQKLPPPTPSAARRGIEAVSAKHQASPTSSRAASAPAGRSTVKGNKGETAVLSPTAHQNGAMQGKAPKKANGSLAAAKSSIAHHVNNGSHISKTDSRFDKAKSECLAYWSALNPAHPSCPWVDADSRALMALLKSDPNLTLSEFKRLLKNRAASEISSSAMPHKWLRNLVEYSSGPLSGYGKPRRTIRNL